MGTPPQPPPGYPPKPGQPPPQPPQPCAAEEDEVQLTPVPQTSTAIPDADDL